MSDLPKPQFVCTECGHKEGFWHCAQQDDRGFVYTWGTLVTCLRCHTPHNIRDQQPVEIKGVA